METDMVMDAPPATHLVSEEKLLGDVKVKKLTLPFSDIAESEEPTLLARYPRLEREVRVAAWTLPKGSQPVPFMPFVVWEHILAELAENKNIVGAGPGGTAGSNIHELHEKLAKAGGFPTRTEEYREAADEGLEGNVFQVQLGGQPFNWGNAIVFLTEGQVLSGDPLIAQKESYKGFFRSMKYTGIAFSENGEPHVISIPAMPEADNVSYASYRTHILNSLEKYKSALFSLPLVVDGKPLTGQELFQLGGTGDSRHSIAHLYVGGLATGKEYGKVLSGSVFQQEIEDLFLQGRGGEVWKAVSEGRAITLDWYTSDGKESTSRTLLQHVLDAPDEEFEKKYLKDLVQYGVIENGTKTVEEAKNAIQSILQSKSFDYYPKLGVYPHVIWGLDADKRVVIVATSGLLEGKVSGQSGVTLEGLALVAQKAGLVSAFAGSQGLDSLHLLFNGEFVGPRTVYDQRYADMATRIPEKKATTPSVFFRLPN